MPLAAHSPNYNFSVWHIALKGVTDATLVSRALLEHAEHRESMTIRLMLKHLRARGHQSAFNALLKSAQMEAPRLDQYPPMSPVPVLQRTAQRPFEHPLVTQLFQAIMRGDWDAAEDCLERSAGDDGDSSFDGQHRLFAAYVSKCAQQAQWTRLDGTDRDGDLPSPRGGHQLVVDSARGAAYLFGGWDGERDLNDLWLYNIADSRWRRLSSDTSEQGGPGPRSCHQMAYSSRSGLIYVLGRYVDYPTESETASDDQIAHSSAPSGGRRAPALTTSRDSPATDSTAPQSTAQSDCQPSEPQTSLPIPAPGKNYLSDFFRFSTRNERWDRLSSDTSADGGPKLLFDHQMVVDDESQILYLFGGRVAHWNPAKIEFSGMWRYDCIQRTWTFVFDDDTRTKDKILGRIGHSMLLDVGRPGERRRQLWIMAGQRGDSYLGDMYTYDLVTRNVREITHDYSRGGKGPEPSFTQRAIIEPNKRQIYLFSGGTKRNKSDATSKTRSSFWLYQIDRNEWTMIWQGRSSGSFTDHTESALTERRSAESADDSDYQDDEEPELVRAPLRLSSGDDEDMTPQEAATASKSQGRKQRHRDREPSPRYAAQFGYEPNSETFFLFGGNPTDPGASTARLGDLWSLKLLRPGVKETLRRAKFAVRQQRFREMAAAVPRPGVADTRSPRSGDLGGSTGSSADGGIAAMQALVYLQTKVAEVVDHNVAEESRAFRKLVAGLLRGEGGHESDESTLIHGNLKGKPDASMTSPVESDGLPAVDDDADMLSISQTLPATRGDSVDLTRTRPMDPSQQPSPLFARRLELFRQLLRLYPAEATEPAEDLGLAINSSRVRIANRR